MTYSRILGLSALLSTPVQAGDEFNGFNLERKVTSDVKELVEYGRRCGHEGESGIVSFILEMSPGNLFHFYYRPPNDALLVTRHLPEFDEIYMKNGDSPVEIMEVTYVEGGYFFRIVEGEIFDTKVSWKGNFAKRLDSLASILPQSCLGPLINPNPWQEQEPFDKRLPKVLRTLGYG